MKAAMRLPTRLMPRVVNMASLVRPIHSTIAKPAYVAPLVGTGPPPEPPLPAKVNANQRVARRKKHAEMLQNARDLRSAQSHRGSLKRRFWKDVKVTQADGKSSM